jgi:hypothetical protein
MRRLRRRSPLAGHHRMLAALAGAPAAVKRRLLRAPVARGNLFALAGAC